MYEDLKRREEFPAQKSPRNHCSPAGTQETQGASQSDESPQIAEPVSTVLHPNTEGNLNEGPGTTALEPILISDDSPTPSPNPVMNEEEPSPSEVDGHIPYRKRTSKTVRRTFEAEAHSQDSMPSSIFDLQDQEASENAGVSSYNNRAEAYRAALATQLGGGHWHQHSPVTAGNHHLEDEDEL
jgi:hypothetical protein